MRVNTTCRPDRTVTWREYERLSAGSKALPGISHGSCSMLYGVPMVTEHQVQIRCVAEARVTDI
jgi:hypothetical protein